MPAGAQDGLASVFAVTHETAVPGRVLKAGTYTIQIVDHLSDRSVIRISSENKAPITFLAVSSPNVTQSLSIAPVSWNKKLRGNDALRGYNFPQGRYVEFVYPKDDAVALANANRESVVAVDPASENRPELAKLSPSDLQLVNLWSLTPVKVSPANDAALGIEARRYNASLASGAQPPISMAAGAGSEESLTLVQTIGMAEVHKPWLLAERIKGKAPKRLPLTASYDPLLALLAVLFLGTALWTRRLGQSVP